MAGKVRELEWSLSRGRMFEECPRRFYYHYYFAKAGFAPDAPDEARLALEMRRLKGLDMWVGEIVHQVIQWTLEQAKAGTVISKPAAQSQTRHLLSDGWKCSITQEWRKKQDDEHPSLFEHYYEVPVGKAVTDRLKEKAFTSIGNFMDSDIFKEIAAAPAERWLPIDKYASFRLDGLLMYVKFDFALRDGKRLTVYDWKTGNPTPDEDRQLTCYSMYTSSKWDIPIKNVKACAVHLQPTLEEHTLLVDEDGMDDLRTFVKQGFNAMVQCLRNPARNIAAMDDFAVTGNLLRCVRCNFKRICEQGRLASGELEGAPPTDDWGETQPNPSP